MTEPERRRCYLDDCSVEATYQARLLWTSGVMFLCVEHAGDAREWHDVKEIKTMSRGGRP